MHLRPILAALAFTFTSASAASIPRQDPHVLDFRTWGSKDCGEDNQGIWTFTQSDITAHCKSFASYGADNVQSITLVDIDSEQDHTCENYPRSFETVDVVSYNANRNVSLLVQVFYASDDCSTEEEKYYFPVPGECYSPPEGSLRSFRLT